MTGNDFYPGRRVFVNTGILFILAPFLGALLSPALVRVLGEKAAWLLAIIPAAVFVHLCSYIAPVASGEVVTMGLSWVPSLGANLSYYIDGLSLVFALLISGIGTLIILYSGGYLKGHRIRAGLSRSCSCSWGRCLGLFWPTT